MIRVCLSYTKEGIWHRAPGWAHCSTATSHWLSVSHMVVYICLPRGEGWGGGGREARERGTHVYRWLAHLVVQQKPTQQCKAIILQLKIFIKEFEMSLEYFWPTRSLWEYLVMQIWLDIIGKSHFLLGREMLEGSVSLCPNQCSHWHCLVTGLHVHGQGLGISSPGFSSELTMNHDPVLELHAFTSSGRGGNFARKYQISENLIIISKGSKSMPIQRMPPWHIEFRYV